MWASLFTQKKFSEPPFHIPTRKNNRTKITHNQHKSKIRIYNQLKMFIKPHNSTRQLLSPYAFLALWSNNLQAPQPIQSAHSPSFSTTPHFHIPRLLKKKTPNPNYPSTILTLIFSLQWLNSLQTQKHTKKKNLQKAKNGRELKHHTLQLQPSNRPPRRRRRRECSWFNDSASKTSISGGIRHRKARIQSHAPEAESSRAESH